VKRRIASWLRHAAHALDPQPQPIHPNEISADDVDTVARIETQAIFGRLLAAQRGAPEASTGITVPVSELETLVCLANSTLASRP
jgi:hypothetical protein